MKKRERRLNIEKHSGLILTCELTSKEKEKARLELAEARKKIQSTVTDEDRLAVRTLQFKLKLKDTPSDRTCY